MKILSRKYFNPELFIALQKNTFQAGKSKKQSHFKFYG